MKHNKYICNEVVRTPNGKILIYKIQDSERTKINGTGKNTNKPLTLSLIFFLYLKKSETKTKFMCSAYLITCYVFSAFCT